MDATVPGFEPLPVLTPTPAECATDWWRESCQFFDGYANDSSPLLKKVRLSSPPQPSVMVHELLAEDVTDTTTMPVEDIVGITTMPRSDNTTNHQSTACRENMEKTMLDTQVDELYYANLKVKNHIGVATEIRDRLGPGSARSELFRGTCFGPWLDLQSTSRLRFGPDHWEYGRADMTFRERPGLEPLPVLTPTPAECATDWWRDSCQFFADYANDSSSLLKKVRLSSPSQPSVVVCDQLTEDIADTATMPVDDIADITTMPLDDIADTTAMPVDDTADTTTMPSSDNSTSQQSAGWRANMEKTTVENKLQKPLVMTCVTNYEDCIDDLWEAREPHCVKTDMPTTSDLLCPFDHVEDNVRGKVSSQFNTTCVQGYEVNQSVAPILESIFKKHENTGLVKNAALRDLRESFEELMAAQERFEKAERCVRVLNLVEKNINDNILESKGNIDSGSRQPVL
ncbi:hypothetical protein M8C21_015810 [Ambrosia artemisiifolia]|uniref:Uncharacterized protein n=1 Tax=Ambrosia artemisiifolia TaxID=4212 RepID=A0AAD5D3Q1_AMBAR|nr:hypothetical protein M8C21_015810 [Ambrosia artemisiifolia]